MDKVNKKNISVCVVMPHYNQGKFINEALESIAQQTFTDIELVICDDCSQDKESFDIIKKLGKQKTLLNSKIPLTVIKNNKNKGAAFSRNEAIKITKAKYILPLDSDDKIAPSYIEKAVEVLEKNNDVGIVYCRARFFGDRDEEWILPEFKMPDILYGNCIFCSAMFRRKLWERAGHYSANLKNDWEDYDL